MSKSIVDVVRKLDGSPFIIEVLINKSFYANTFMHSGCLCYSAFNKSFVKRHKLPRIPIECRGLQLAKNDLQRQVINEITFIDMDIDGRTEKVWGYIIKNLAYDIILGDPWMRNNDVIYNAHRHSIRFGPPGGLVVKSKGREDLFPASSNSNLKCLKVKSGNARQILGTQLMSIISRLKKKTKNGWY